MLNVGFNTAHRESSAAIARDGLLAAFREEYLDRIKHAKLSTVEAPIQPPHDDAAIQQALGAFRLAGTPATPRLLAQRIARGEVIAWFSGRMAFGPRTLGSSAILADPRSLEGHRRLKRRALFRPLCTSVLAECVEGWFETGPALPSAASYTLMAFPVREAVRDVVPAVQHTDGTAHLQALRRDESQSFYDVIAAFYALTGVPMVLNTSFDSLEPLGCTPEDALKTFLRTDLDALVLGERVLTRADITAAMFPAR